MAGRVQVEYATLEHVDWFDNRRLHGEIGHLPPAEFEAVYYRERRSPRSVLTINRVSTDPGAFQLDTGRPVEDSRAPETGMRSNDAVVAFTVTQTPWCL